MNNRNLLLRPCTWVYVLLLLLTFATWLVGINELSGPLFAFLVLGIALLKGQLIGDYFMGLKLVSGAWRWVVFIWLLLIGIAITSAFWTTLQA